MTGAQYLVRTLQERGVEYVFLLCGNGLKPFLDECVDCRMKVIDVRNEEAAAYMADTWGRMTRRIGVCAVSAGPGHTNALTGLANAWWDGGPMLLLSGCSPASTRGLGHFQELDQVAMAAPASKYARLVERVETLPHELNTALSLAVSGRPGPVHLTVPLDVMSAQLDEKKLPKQKLPIAEVNLSVPGDPDLVREAVKMLHHAQRPFLIVGSGAFYAQAGEALCRFAELTGIPVMSLLWDRGCIDGAWRQYVGVSSGEVNGAYEMLAQADVVLTLGARVDYRLGYGRPPVFAEDVRWIRVDVEPSELTKTLTPEIAIIGDPRSVLEQMSEEAQRLGRWTHEGWLEQVRQRRQAFLAKWEPRGRQDVCPLPSLRICREIQKFLESEITFLLDGGNIGRWAHLVLWERHPHYWHTCGASGVVGWGVAGAVAAKLARPEHPVLMLIGDGSAGFTLADIETALRFHTPYVAVVAHDGAWGIEADAKPQDRRLGTLLGEIRFDKVAQALGARGVFIEHPAQLAPAIAEALKQDTVTFIHVPTQLGGIRYFDERGGP